MRAGFVWFRALEDTCGWCESRIWTVSCFDEYLGRLVVGKGKGPGGDGGRIWVVLCFDEHLGRPVVGKGKGQAGVKAGFGRIHALMSTWVGWS